MVGESVGAEADEAKSDRSIPNPCENAVLEGEAGVGVSACDRGGDVEGDGDFSRGMLSATSDAPIGSSSRPSTGPIISAPSASATTAFLFISSSLLPYNSFQKRTSLGFGNKTPMSALGSRRFGLSKVASNEGFKFF